MGRRESVYSSADHGRFPVASYADSGEKGDKASAGPTVRRLMNIVARGGGVDTPGTLRGNPVSLVELVDPEDREWVQDMAERETESGVIWVHEQACAAMLARKGSESGKGPWKGPGSKRPRRM